MDQSGAARAAMEEQDVVVMRGITKIYANGIVANKDVDFTLR